MRKTSNSRDCGTVKSDKNGKKTGNLRGQQRTVNGAPFRDDSRGSKNARRAEEAVDTFAVMSKSNPLSYYTKFSRFAEDAANLPFALPLGAPINVRLDEESGSNYTVPGIMRIVFSPAIGISTGYTSAINRSSTRFFTYLRSNQKASANYDHQDITMMELALDSAYMFHAHCRRLYGVMQNVTPLNEYYARALVAAMGGDYANLRSNLADFRAWINTYAYNLGQYSLPDGITLFDRHRWMCDGIYVDSGTTRAQTYVFVPYGFWQYDNTVTTGSQLTMVPFMSSSANIVKQYSVTELMNIGNNLLDHIAGEEDFQYISGDIYNFYGGQAYQLPYVEENYKVLPAFEKTVLSQIENLTIMGDFATSPVVSQNPSVNEGAIIYNPTFALGSALIPQEKMYMNFHWDSPTSGDVIEASRLIAIPDVIDGSHFTLKQCGTEIVHWCDVLTVSPTTLIPSGFRINNTIQLLASDGTNSNTALRDILFLAQFDWAPGVRVFLNDVTTSAKTFLGFTWDIDNIAEIYSQYLETIHEACLYSLFEVGTNRIDLTN